jgi:hypothetical protein
MKITLAASAMLAMSFTLGCSDDKEEEDKYCVITMSLMDVIVTQCYELDAQFTANSCKEVEKNGGSMITSKTTSSKPKDTECPKYSTAE